MTFVARVQHQRRQVFATRDEARIRRPAVVAGAKTRASRRIEVVARFEEVDWILENEADDSADRIRAVQRRRGTTQDLDGLHDIQIDQIATRVGEAADVESVRHAGISESVRSSRAAVTDIFLSACGCTSSSAADAAAHKPDNAAAIATLNARFLCFEYFTASSPIESVVAGDRAVERRRWRAKLITHVADRTTSAADYSSAAAEFQANESRGSILTASRDPNILWPPAVLTPTGGPKRESGATLIVRSIPELPRSGNRERTRPSH